MIFSDVKRESVKKADELRRSVDLLKKQKGYTDASIAKDIGVSPTEFQRFVQGQGQIGEESSVYEPCLTFTEKHKASRGSERKAKKLPKPAIERIRKSPAPEEEGLLKKEHEGESDQEEAFDWQRPSPIMNLSDEEGEIGEYRSLLAIVGDSDD